MKGITNQSVGPTFKDQLLSDARDKTLFIIEAISKKISPGMTELDAIELLKTTQRNEGILKSWHPPQIRFGKNSILSFGQKGIQNSQLKENDIYFLDLGLIHEEHEGDVGRTFVLGNDSLMIKCKEDVQIIWEHVREKWKESGISGAELYDFAEHLANEKGWQLNRKQANGHRISDFPHIARNRGSIEYFNEKLKPYRWILEIQICHPENLYGAFYEDLLN